MRRTRRSSYRGAKGPELGNRLGGMRSASATALVDRLESAGHVERRRHPSDRRRLVVVPTEQAFKTGQEAFSPLEVGLEEAAGELTDEECAVVARYLDRVVEKINSFNESHDMAKSVEARRLELRDGRRCEDRRGDGLAARRRAGGVGGSSALQSHLP